MMQVRKTLSGERKTNKKRSMRPHFIMSVRELRTGIKMVLIFQGRNL